MVVAGAEPGPVSPEKAATMGGRACTVEGAVLDAHRAADGCRLFFTSPSASGLTVVIYSINLHRWTEDVEAVYRGKIVRVSGVVQTFRGTPEMIIAEPSQIVVVGKAAGMPAATVKPETAPPPAPAAAIGAAAPATDGMTAAVSEPPPDLARLPFTVSARRHSGSRHLTSDTQTGATYKRRAYIELTLRNTSNRTVGDIAWVWTAIVGNLMGGADQYHQGRQSRIELQPFETKTIRSEDIHMTGSETRYTTTGNRVRAHYVRVLYKGHCVFKEAGPADALAEIEDYLDRVAKGKPLPQQPPTPTFIPMSDTVTRIKTPKAPPPRPPAR